MYFVNPDGTSVLWKRPIGLTLLYTAIAMDIAAPHHSKDCEYPGLKGTTMQLAIIAFLAAFLLMSSLGVLLFYRHTPLRRLSQVVSRAEEASLLRSIVAPAGSRLERLVKPFQRIVPRNPADLSTVQKRLALAGYRTVRHQPLL